MAKVLCICGHSKFDHTPWVADPCAVQSCPCVRFVEARWHNPNAWNCKACHHAVTDHLRLLTMQYESCHVTGCPCVQCVPGSTPRRRPQPTEEKKPMFSLLYILPSYPTILADSEIAAGTIIEIERRVAGRRVTGSYIVKGSTPVPALRLPPDDNKVTGSATSLLTLTFHVFHGLWIPSFLDEVEALKAVIVQLVQARILPLEEVEARFDRMNKMVALAARAGTEAEGRTAARFVRKAINGIFNRPIYKGVR